MYVLPAPVLPMRRAQLTVQVTPPVSVIKTTTVTGKPTVTVRTKNNQQPVMIKDFMYLSMGVIAIALL